MEALLSVGIDIGTTTTQLVLSRLTLRNAAGSFTVPQFEIAEKTVLFRSAVHFTPLLSDTLIDADGVRAIVAEEYARSGFEKSQVQTGAVIITGETARRENAREVLRALSDFAGDFVVATAGPALESVLAGRGSGAARYSEEHRCGVLNLDIGGGTSNLALFDCGEVVQTGCLNVGGRLMKFDESGRLTYLSPVLRPFFDFPLGQNVPSEQLARVTSLLVEILEEAVGLREIVDKARFRHFVTDKGIDLSAPALLSFSGGVADLIDGMPRDRFAYGDLGVLLGQAIYRSRLCAGHFLRATETIRATVIGAGCHATTLSGSTVFYDGVTFPLRDLPVVALSVADGLSDAAARHIGEKASLVRSDGGAFVLALHGGQDLGFSELCKLADGIALGLRETVREELPLVIAVDADLGKALGQGIRLRLSEAKLVCLDGLRLGDGMYLDIGAPVAGGQALPVVIKTLIF